MTGFIDQPAVVILAAAAATVLLLLEVALPTFGLAGAAGLALGGLAVWGVERQDSTWWPLLAVAVAVGLWGVLIAARRPKAAGHPVATVLFLAGAVGYAVATEDWGAAATALVSTAAVALAFPRIAASAERLSGAPPGVGLESLVGTTGTVDQWEGGRGRVTVAGTRWSAFGPDDLKEGDEVVVVEGTSGLSLTVRPVGSRHG